MSGDLLLPFEGYVVRPELAAELVTPPYETLRPETWHLLARERPRSYQHVVAAEPGDPGGVSREEGLARGVDRLEEMLAEGVLVPTEGPIVLVHQVDVAGRSHAGIVVRIPVDAVARGDLRPHEEVRAEKTQRFAQHLRAVEAASTPALITQRDPHATTELIDGVRGAQAPTIDVAAPDGSRHQIWWSDGRRWMEQLERLAHDIDALYVVDGHHRIAAAVHVADERRSQDAAIHALLVPPDALRIRAFHRCVALDGIRNDDVLDGIRQRADVEQVPSAETARPTEQGEFGVLLGGAAYHVRLPDRASSTSDPVARFDAAALHDELLQPVLGLDDPATDERLDFVPDPRGLGELEERCAGGDEIAFILRPATLEDVLRVADAGRTVPPKSTWFQPKLPSGLYLVRHDRSA